MKTQTEAHTPSDTTMENIAVLDALERLDFTPKILDRVERAVNAYDEDQRKIGMLTKALDYIATGMPDSDEKDKFAHARYYAADKLARIAQAEARP